MFHPVGAGEPVRVTSELLSSSTVASPTLDGSTRQFAVWAPNAERVSLLLFVDPADDAEPASWVALDRDEGGTWRGAAEAPAGTEYLYEIQRAGDTMRRIDPRARQVTSSVGRAVVVDHPVRDAHPPFLARPLNEWVIYELHPRTFAGTLRDAAGRLDHVAALGATAVEVMPVAEFAGDVSWGYNPALPFAVESSYGGPAAMHEFVDAAHALGLAVVVDVVYNHFGPSDLDLWRFDGWSEGDGGGIYFFQDWRAETPWGATRPDYGRPEVRDFILDNVRMWFGEFGVDGLRLDSTVNIRNAHGTPGPDGDLPEGWSLLTDIADVAHEEFDGKVLIAEDLQRDPRLTEPRVDGGAGFDLQWAAGFVHAVRAALEAVADDARDVDAVLAAWLGSVYPAARVVYTESHDEVANGRTRVPAEIDADDPGSMPAVRRSAIGAVLTMTAVGVPMVFQGQEWADEDWFDDASPLQWSRRDERDGIVQLWGDLCRLRTGVDDRAPGLRGDQVRAERHGPDGRVLVLQRWGIGGPDQAALVLVNTTADDIDDIDLTGSVAAAEWTCVFASDASAYHVTGTDRTPATIDLASVTLPAYGAAIYVRAAT